jgi:calcium-dependent protein kinase
MPSVLLMVIERTIVGVFEACDSLGLMHKDLKPDNLLFRSVRE